MPSARGWQLDPFLNSLKFILNYSRIIFIRKKKVTAYPSSRIKYSTRGYGNAFHFGVRKGYRCTTPLWPSITIIVRGYL